MNPQAGTGAHAPPGVVVLPERPAGFVPRPALAALLDRSGRPAEVTLLRAPAGFGKTALLADWLARTGTADKAWLRVRRTDEHPGRFWAAVLAALRRCPVVPPGNPLRALTVPADPDPDFLAELVDGLAAVPTRLHLVLDDLHQLRAPDHGLATLIRHQPPGLRLVLATRTEPALPLAKLRPQRRLTELTAEQLRFSPAEADRLLRAAGVPPLRPARRDRLHTLLDGWPAGLAVAARALRAAPDTDALLASLAAGDRTIAGQLTGSVLAGLPWPTRRFLRQLCVCAEVDADLAERLSGQADAGPLLAGLARDNPLVLRPSGPGRYRLQPVLRAGQLAALHRRRPELAARQHAAAATWFAAAGQPAEAVRQAGRAGRTGMLAELLREHGISLLLRGELATVRAALVAIGRADVADDPRLGLVSAFAWVQAGDRASAEADLARSRPAAEDDPVPARVAALVAAGCALTGDWDVPTADLDTLWRSDRDGELGAWTRLVLGRVLLRDGDRGAARHELLAAVRAAHELGLSYLSQRAQAALTVLHALDGDYPEMVRAGARSLRLVRTSGRPEYAATAEAHTLLGFAALFRLDPASAARHAGRTTGPAPVPTAIPAGGERRGERRPVGVVALRAPGFAAEVVQGTAWFDAGYRTRGLRRLRHARQWLGPAVVPAQLVCAAALIEHQAAVLLGWETAAREVLAWARERTGRSAESALLTARAEAARAPDAARAALRPVLDGAVPALIPPTLVDAWLLEAALALRADERTRARHALAEALLRAGPAGLLRPFEYAEPTVRQLLVDQLGGFGPAEAFAGRVHRALSVRSDNPPPAPHGSLTGQERVVLAQLTSQRSLEEVAVELAVSVNTVKTHVRSIYAKLGVNNRRAAVITARERRLA